MKTCVPSVLGLEGDVVLAVEAAEVSAAMEQWIMLAIRANTIFWPNRQDVRELCAKTARSLLTDSTCRRQRYWCPAWH